MTMLRTLVTLVLAVLMTACTANRIPGPDNRIIAAHHKAAKYLIQMAGSDLPSHGRLIAASFADVNNLTSSTFGRIASQQLVSSFVIEGYSFVEMLMRNSVYIDSREGEFLLSREVTNISQQHNAAAVLVGTYAVGKDNVFVTARLVRTSDNVIIGSYDYTVPLTPELRALVLPQRTVHSVGRS